MINITWFIALRFKFKPPASFLTANDVSLFCKEKFMVHVYGVVHYMEDTVIENRKWTGIALDRNEND